MFSRIRINQWRQIDEVEIDFDNQITVITGANGSGKTTILNILSQYFGWNLSFISKPSKNKKGDLSYLKSFWQFDREGLHLPPEKLHGDRTTIGEVELIDGSKQDIRAQGGNNATYRVNVGAKSKVSGLHIPSHRPISNYENINNIPTEAKSRDKAFNDYRNNVSNRIQNDNIRQNPIFHIKEALISWATFGYGNQAVRGDERAVELFEGFQEILDTVLPEELGFEELEVRVPEVVLITDSGEFALDAVSGGISSIIGIAWQIYLFDPEGEEYVVTIDEPENHLHPRLQRSILPSLTDAFPSAQFIVTTHSPLVVGSDRNSKVYVLKFGNENKVSSYELGDFEKSGTSNEILRDVLGVPSTMPIWAADELEGIVEEYSDKEINEETILEMTEELKNNGIENQLSQALMRIKSDK